MDCPDCHTELQETDYFGVRIDECPKCLGRWFDRDELRRAKDRSDPDLRWLDFDLFAGHVDPPTTRRAAKLCPRCSVAMGTSAYERSGVLVDVCQTCRGAWLDHGEFEKIVGHLEHEVVSESAAQYGRDVERQFGQIVTGPEGPVSELRDFFAVLGLLEMRLAVEHPTLAQTAQQAALMSPLR